MKAIFLLTALLSFSAFAETKIEIPADGLLALARTVVPQTGPYYSVNGTMACAEISADGQTAALCYLGIANIEMDMDMTNALPIIEKVKLVIPADANEMMYKFGGRFEATSVSSEFPPFTVTEKAFITIE